MTREIQAWIQPEDPAAAAPDRLPCWLLERPGQAMAYGIPVDPLAEGAPRAKLALHGSGPTVDPETVDRAVHPAEIAALQALAGSSLPGLPGPVVDAKVCLYTMTPDEHFILDRVPGMDRAFFAAGLSGHGFKLAPALGQALADLALDGRTALPVGFLRLDRLAL